MKVPSEVQIKIQSRVGSELEIYVCMTFFSWNSVLSFPIWRFTYLYVSRFNSEDWNTIVSSKMEHSRKKIIAISNEAKDCPICHLHFRNNKAFASDCLHCFCYQCISNWVQVSSIKCFIVHFSLHQFFELSSCFSASSHVSTMS